MGDLFVLEYLQTLKLRQPHMGDLFVLEYLQTLKLRQPRRGDLFVLEYLQTLKLRQPRRVDLFVVVECLQALKLRQPRRVDLFVLEYLQTLKLRQPRRGDLFVVVSRRNCKMANTFSQIYIQIVFAVKGRQNLISATYREELHKYITGIVRNRDQKLLSIFCMPDHTHLLVSLKPSIAISDLVRDIKADSSNFVNDKKWVNGKFHWQDGFGAFSYSRSHIDSVVKYILNQEEHHKGRSFKEEYVGYLKEFAIDYEEEYLFQWIE